MRHPITNTLNILLVTCIANNNNNVKFVSCINIYPIGNKNQIKYMQITVINIAIQKCKISKFIISNINFKNNFIPSVMGVSIPNKSKAGPILNWKIANTFLSHKLNIPDKTINTIINIKIIIMVSITKSIWY